MSRDRARRRKPDGAPHEAARARARGRAAPGARRGALGARKTGRQPRPATMQARLCEW